MFTPKPTVKLRMKARVAWNDFSSILLVQTNLMSIKSNHVRCFQETESSSVLVFFFSCENISKYVHMRLFFFFCPSGELTRSLARSPVYRQSLRAKEEISFSSAAVFVVVVCLFWIVSRNHFTADVRQRGKTTTTTTTPLSNNTSVKLSPVLIIYVINTRRNTKRKQVVFFRCSHRSCVYVFSLVGSRSLFLNKKIDQLKHHSFL